MIVFARICQAALAFLTLVVFLDATLPGPPGLVDNRNMGMVAALLSVMVIGLIEVMVSGDAHETNRARNGHRSH